MNCRRTRSSGQTAIMFTLVLTAMFGAVGLVTDLGWTHYKQQTAEAAAQAAALATVKSAMALSGGTCSTNNVICQTPATNCPASVTTVVTNLDAGCAYAGTNGYISSGKQSVSIETGTGPINGVHVTYWAIARVTEQVPQMFSAVLGNTTANLLAKSVVGFVPATAGGCIYVIAPTGSSLTTNGNTQLTTGCGVWVNSNSSTAINMSGGNTTITDTNPDTAVQIVGGYSCYGQTAGCITPAPQTGAPTAGDPLAGLEPPTAGSCTPIPSGTNITLNPGTYCGNVNLNGSDNLTMNPGTYIFKSGGSGSCGLSASANANITGTGVFMYFQDSCNVSFTGNGTINLSAPTTGMYQSILMFQDRNDTTSSALAGGAGQALNGIVYFPDALLHYAGGSSSNINAPSATIIAYNLSLDGSSYIWNAGNSIYLNTFSGYALIE